MRLHAVIAEGLASLDELLVYLDVDRGPLTERLYNIMREGQEGIGTTWGMSNSQDYRTAMRHGKLHFRYHRALSATLPLQGFVAS